MANRVLPQTLRDLRLQISVLIELVQNGEQSKSATQIAAIKTIVDDSKTAIDNATDATITTL